MLLNEASRKFGYSYFVYAILLKGHMEPLCLEGHIQKEQSLTAKLQ